jgi:hypothetical protein
MAFWELKADVMGLLSLTAVVIREVGTCPFWIIPLHLPCNWGKAGEAARVTEKLDYSLRLLGWFVEGQPRLACRASVQSPVGASAFQVAASANFESKLTASASMSSAKKKKKWNPKFLWICLLATHQSALVAMLRHWQLPDIVPCSGPPDRTRVIHRRTDGLLAPRLFWRTGRLFY